MNKRKQIMDEVLRRLSQLDLTIEPRRGLPGVVISTFPSVYAIEGVEEIEYPERGVYYKRLPVAIEYYKKGVRAKDCYDKATEMLTAIFQTMEQDEDFNGLCVRFYAYEDEVVYYAPPQESVAASVGYYFEYTDNFLGIPDNDNESVTIGRGTLYAAAWNGQTPPADDDFVVVGFCKAFDVYPATESVLWGTPDKELWRQREEHLVEPGYSIEFSVVDNNIDNLKRFVLGASSGQTVGALTDLDKVYALRFVSDNLTGPDYVWDFWKVKLKNQGGLSLVTEEALALPYVGTGLADLTNHPDDPYFDIKFV